jgi:rare lipoprotein A (peptidoglycan hydrolase)
MMSRALKAFPSMVISVLLASPAFASTGSAHRDRHEDHTVSPRRVTQAAEHRRTSAASAVAPVHTRVARAGARVTAATRWRRARSAPSNTAFLNDATLWTRSGSDGATAPAASRTEAASGEAGVETGAHPHVIQVGLASWYGGARWQGHPMSSGARYDEAALTAAHATLPLGSRVLVSLTGGSRSVVVTITDRPGTRKRIIDLSRAAAAALGILDRGIAQVALSPL